MEDIKRRFANDIAAKLAAAPESDAKAEMIEELAENLAGRYEDMLAAGMPAEEAFQKAMDQLGDVDELTAYLAGQEPKDAGTASGGPDVDAFFRTAGDLGRAVGGIARETAGMVGDFLRSDSFRDSVRSAAQEGKQAAREARDLIKSMAAAWEGTAAHIHTDDGDGSGGDERKSIPSQGVLRLDVETTGDVDLGLDEDPQAPVWVEGNMARLEVSVTEEGVLTVRPLFTASNQFFTFRGVSRQDVSLTIPARTWESIRLATDSGDVHLGGELAVGSLTVHTRSGDIDCQVKSCQQAELKTVSGDIQMEGNAARLCVSTLSGDVDLRGPMGETEITTTSGDVELSGSVWKARVKSMSGDIRLESMTLPAVMDLTSTSGDVEARVPDNGPFKVQASSTSGRVDLRPFAQWSGSDGAGRSAPVPQYTLASISGDVSLDKC